MTSALARFGDLDSDCAGEHWYVFQVVHGFAGATPELESYPAARIVEDSPDAITAAWRIWAVNYLVTERGALSGRTAFLAEAFEVLDGTDEDSARLVYAELLTAMAAWHLGAGHGGRALPFLSAAQQLWTDLVDQALQELPTGSSSWTPSILEMVDTLYAALGDTHPSGDVQRLRGWLAERPVLAMQDVLKGRVTVGGAGGRVDRAREEAAQARAWLERRYHLAPPFSVRDAHVRILMALYDIEIAAFDSPGAARTYGAAEALLRDGTGEGTVMLRTSIRLHRAPRLLEEHRIQEALALLEGAEEFYTEGGHTEAVLRVRSARCHARWAAVARKQSPRDPALADDVRRLIIDWETFLRHGEARFHQRTRYVKKTHLTGAYRLLLIMLAEDAAGHEGDYIKVVDALRRPDALSELESHEAGLNQFEVIQSYLPDGACALFVERGTWRLTLGLVDQDGATICAASEELTDALGELVFAYRTESAQVLAGVEPQGSTLAAKGEAFWQELPEAIRARLERADTLYCSLDPSADIDETPLELAHPADGWLGTTRVVVRVRSPSDAIAQLAPHPRVQGRPSRARIVVAPAPEGYATLEAGNAEAVQVERITEHLGLTAERTEVMSPDELASEFASRACLIHYVGHGVAHELSEAAVIGPGDGLEPDRLPDLWWRPVCYLSCCELARFRFVYGGGSESFAHALNDRGAAAVLSYTQPVPDRDALRLAREFYRAASSLPVGAAARTARERAMELGVSPVVAASLVLSGDPTAMLGSASPERADWVTLLLRSLASDPKEYRRQAAAQLPSRPWRQEVLAWLGGELISDGQRIAERVRADDPRGGAALEILAISERLAGLAADAPEAETSSALEALERAISLAELLAETLPAAALTVELVSRAGDRIAPKMAQVRLVQALAQLARWDETVDLEALYAQAQRTLDEGAESGRFTRLDLSVAPSGPELVAVAASLLDLGAVDRARTMLERAVRTKHPDASPRAAALLGNLLVEAGDVREGREQLEFARASGLPNVAPQAALSLAVLAAPDDPSQAEALLHEVINSGHPEFAATAAQVLRYVRPPPSGGGNKRRRWLRRR